tara:strand:- start:1065 stop:2279 length:1215 start_codon:yes stop_codon:yes gene_type:complete
MDQRIAKFASRCCFEAEREVRRLERQYASGASRRKVGNRSHQIALGYKMRLYSALKAARKSGDKLTFSALQSRAAAAKNYNAPTESFTKFSKKKWNGSSRIIFSFGPIRKAQQETLKALLIATTPEPQYDYCHQGRRGHHGAICKIREALLAGTRFWMVTDIKNAFPSMTMEHATPHTYVSKRLLLRVGFYFSHKGSARPELPQGGKHSSYICSAVIDGVLRKLYNPDVEKVAFSDNVTIGATTKAHAVIAFQQIETELASLKAGPLALHHTVFSVGDQHRGKFSYQGFKGRGSIWFCGYAASLDKTTDYVRIRANKIAFDKVKVRIRAEFFKPLSNEQLEAVYEELTDPPSDHWLFNRLKNEWARSGYPEWKWVTHTYEHLTNTFWVIAQAERAERGLTAAAD